MSRRRLVAGLVLALLGSAAQATVYTVDWTGRISNGEDETGVFGPIGSLDGQIVMVSFRVDTGTYGAIHQSSPGFSQVTGSLSASPVHATVTLNGVTRRIGFVHDILGPLEGTQGLADEYDKSQHGFESTRQFAADIFLNSGFNFLYRRNNFANAYAYSLVNEFVDGDVETRPGPHLWNGDDEGFGDFRIESFTSRNSVIVQREKASGVYVPISFNVTALQGVPEPDTWALLIAGFGLVGAALRRRQATESACAG